MPAPNSAKKAGHSAKSQKPACLHRNHLPACSGIGCRLAPDFPAMAIIRDVEAMPKDWPQSQAKWIKFIATKNDISVRKIRRTLARDKKFGVAGHRHTKNRQKLRVPKEARDFAVVIVCKSEHRRFTKKEAHELYKIEAQHKGWPEISYSFMTCLCREYLNAPLKAYRDGGRLSEATSHFVDKLKHLVSG